jgi:MFS family permease
MTPPPAILQTLSVGASYAAAGVFWGALAASAPAIQARAGLDPGGYGLTLGVMTLAALPVMQVFGRQVGRLRPWAIPACMAAFAAGTLVLAVAPGLWGLILAFAILGASSGALDISLNSRIARIEEDTGLRLFNRMHAVFPLAMLGASAGTGWLRGAGVGLTTIFGVVTVVLLAMAAVERRAGRHQAPDAAAAARGGRLLGGAALLFGVMAACSAFQESASNSWSAIFLETVRGASPALSGLAPAAFVLGLALGRIGAHELEARMSPRATVATAACLALPAFILLPHAEPVWLLLGLFLLAGIGVGPVEPAVFRSVARGADAARRGPMLATVTSVAYMGYLLSPPILGQISQHAGWAAMWGAAAVAAALVAVLASSGAGARQTGFGG